MTVLEAARLMGCDPQFLRLGLQQERFPFGFAVKMKKHWSYYINEDRLKEWLRGDA